MTFEGVTDAELGVMRDAVDALALVTPARIEDRVALALVHELLNEIAARRNLRLLGRS